jgi:hypothetical protein
MKRNFGSFFYILLCAIFAAQVPKMARAVENSQNRVVAGQDITASSADTPPRSKHADEIQALIEKSRKILVSNPTQAEEWLEQAYELKEENKEDLDAGEAAFTLGNLYLSTADKTPDTLGTAAIGSAIAWYRKALEAGYYTAANNLGVLYFEGKRHKKEFAKAAYYYRLGAQKGVAQAQFNLALMILKGEMPNDSANSQDLSSEALQALQQAAEQNLLPAQTQLGRILLTGDAKLDIAKNAEQAAHWLARAARGGDALAQFFYAAQLQRGLGIKRDLSMAVDWYEAAAKQNLAGAKFELAKALELGLGVTANPARARTLLLEAAALGHIPSQNKLAGQIASAVEVPATEVSVTKVPAAEVPAAEVSITKEIPATLEIEKSNDAAMPNDAVKPSANQPALPSPDISSDK